MTVGARSSLPSAEAITSGAGASTGTEGPRVLHEAGLNGGVAWIASTSRDSTGGRRRGGCRFASVCLENWVKFSRFQVFTFYHFHVFTFCFLHTMTSAHTAVSENGSQNEGKGLGAPNARADERS